MHSDYKYYAYAIYRLAYLDIDKFHGSYAC